MTCEEDLEQFKKDLQKWKTNGAKSTISILTRFKEANPDKELLKKTKILSTIQTLSQSDMEDKLDSNQREVIQLAKDITLHFRKLYSKKSQNEKQSEKSPPQSSSELKSQNQNSLKRLNSQNSNAAQDKIQEEKLIPAFKIEENKNDSYNELLPQFSNDQSYRTNGLKTMLNHMKNLENEITIDDENTNEKIAENAKNIAFELEKQIYKKNYIIFKDREGVKNGYIMDIKQLNKALKDLQVGKEIRSKLYFKSLKIEDLATCKSEFLSSEQLIKQIEQKEKEQLDALDPKYYEKIMQKARQKLGGEKCPKCKEMQAFIIQSLQTRSADEPMTDFYKCFACSREWKR